MRARAGTAWCTLAVAALAACRGGDAAVADAIRGAASAERAPDYVPAPRWKLVKRIYQQREYRALWTSGGKPTGRARELVDALCHAEREGLNPAQYGLDDLRRQLQRIRGEKERAPAEIAELELRLTGMFTEYGGDLLAGRLDPAAVDSGWYIRARRSSVDSTLAAAAGGRDFGDMVAPLVPRQPEYRELLQALGRYRQLLAAGGWAKVPGGGPLRPGSSGPRVAALRDRLAAMGDLESAAGEPAYDREVARAVSRYQVRHGLEANGVVGPATFAALDVPLERRIRQIELNLERYRWLPAEFGARYILVNIPDYRLYAFDGGKQVLEQRVIVGGEYENATPVFMDSMTYVVFNPDWDVPKRILVDEMMPHLRDDPAYLARNGYEVVDRKGDSVLDATKIDWGDVDTAQMPFRVRQLPGLRNPLGRVKFMFPNQFSIYLHDTPSQELFDRSKRTLSHGCVRVENPLRLASFVLAGQRDWGEDEIRAAMQPPKPAPGDSAAITKEKVVKLERPVPVYLLYLTAYVRDGVLQFRDDPYDRDGRAMARLGKLPPADPERCKELQELMK
jgi:murein L,D-transpeptidase YcbB/YkuD